MRHERHMIIFSFLREKKDRMSVGGICPKEPSYHAQSWKWYLNEFKSAIKKAFFDCEISVGVGRAVRVGDGSGMLLASSSGTDYLYNSPQLS